jgi:hypothetical protein
MDTSSTNPLTAGDLGRGRGTDLEFTIYWMDAGRWEGRNFRIRMDAVA